MANNDSIGRTILISVLLCFVCSLMVSVAAVMLKPKQLENKSLDKKRNILLAAGLYEAGDDIEEKFKLITPRVVDLRTGKFSGDVDALSYDQRKARRDSSLSEALSSDQDIAKIGRKAHYSVIYTTGAMDEPDKIILPISGYGLWSTLHGFVALEGDANTIAGLGFYEHAETPGLGGEIDNPRWKSSWVGKYIYKDDRVGIEVMKGSVDQASPLVNYQIDGLSGATLTSRGVDALMKFWMGEQGFQPFLQNLRDKEA